MHCSQQQEETNSDDEECLPEVSWLNGGSDSRGRQHSQQECEEGRGHTGMTEGRCDEENASESPVISLLDDAPASSSRWNVTKEYRLLLHIGEVYSYYAAMYYY